MDGVYFSTTGLQYCCHKIPSGIIILQFCILNYINLYYLWHTDILYLNGHNDHNANSSSVFVTHVLFILRRWLSSAETQEIFTRKYNLACAQRTAYIWYCHQQYFGYYFLLRKFASKSFLLFTLGRIMWLLTFLHKL